MVSVPCWQDFPGLFFSEIQEVVVGDWRCHGQTSAMRTIKNLDFIFALSFCASRAGLYVKATF